MMTLFMTSKCKNRFKNDVTTADMKSTGINSLNYQSFRHTQPFSVLDKPTEPILVSAALAFYRKKCKFYRKSKFYRKKIYIT